MKRTIFITLLFIAFFLFIWKCTPDLIADHHEKHLLEEIRYHTSPISYDSTEMTDIDSNYFIKVHADLPEVNDFFTERRSMKITSFECSNCHNRPLDKMDLSRDPSQKKAHWNVQMNHAGKISMNCATCHSTDNMNYLISLTGEKINIDESYKLCSQCHSTQFKDWQGGAHGKSLNGWKPPRISKTCVSCHNPHDPKFHSRFPARLNTKTLGE